jgi:hypothetical protein
MAKQFMGIPASERGMLKHLRMYLLTYLLTYMARLMQPQFGKSPASYMLCAATPSGAYQQ